jgi:hypothetical protein
MKSSATSRVTTARFLGSVAQSIPTTRGMKGNVAEAGGRVPREASTGGHFRRLGREELPGQNFRPGPPGATG